MTVSGSIIYNRRGRYEELAEALPPYEGSEPYLYFAFTEADSADELLTLLAREELIENGNWCSCQRDNKPHISI